MNDMSITELEHELHAGDRDTLDPATLSAIRRTGGRRRTARTAMTAVGACTVVAVVGLTLTLVKPDAQGGREDTPQVADPAPRQLDPLARRALDEIPGAKQVSSWQVVLPAPKIPSDYWIGEPPIRVGVESVPLDAKTYHGVTMFRPGVWPAWLRQGTLDFEQTLKEPDGSYPVGSTDNGILVEVGDAELGCESEQDGTCVGPALLTRTADGDLHYEWGMGTEEFLKPGSDMEVFLEEDYSTGSPSTLAIAGLPGTEVARVDYVTTSGQVIPGSVNTTLIEDASMMWASVSGELAKVVAYDADGAVIEDHPLKPCQDPVDCEVR